MPLRTQIRTEVKDYIFADIVPDKHWQGEPMEWFQKQFDFIGDKTLQTHLAEAYYQARFVEKTRSALGLTGQYNNGFVKTQIVLYASIYEAIIDYFLETHHEVEIVKNMLSSESYAPVSAFANNIQLVQKEEAKSEYLFPCRKKKRSMTLKEVQFNDRLSAVYELGLVPESHKEMIKQLYTSRNNIHLLAAAKKEVTPDGNQSSEAFRCLREFLVNARKCFAK